MLHGEMIILIGPKTLTDTAENLKVFKAFHDMIQNEKCSIDLQGKEPIENKVRINKMSF